MLQQQVLGLGRRPQVHPCAVGGFKTSEGCVRSATRHLCVETMKMKILLSIIMASELWLIAFVGAFCMKLKCPFLERRFVL